MAGLTFADFKKQRQKRPVKKAVERRPALTSQEQRFLYSLHLKTIECRTMMATLRNTLTPAEFNHFIVDYTLRLRKAKKNFEENNWKYEWELDEKGNEE